MTTFFRYIIRLIVILAGLTFAALAAAAFFIFAGVLPLSAAVGPNGIETVFEIASTVLLLSLVVASFSLMIIIVPALGLAVLAELFSWNGYLFYGVSGAALGFAASGIWHASRTVAGESHLVLVGAAAGIIGASVYWLIAGRNAGKLFEQILASRSQ